MPAKIHNLDAIKRLGPNLASKFIHGNRDVIAAQHSNATIMPISKPPDKSKQPFKGFAKVETPHPLAELLSRLKTRAPNKPLGAARFRKTLAERQMAKVDIQPAGLYNKQTLETPPNPTTPRNFPENELQLNKHYAAVAQAGPNPADAFR